MTVEYLTVTVETLTVTLQARTVTEQNLTVTVEKGCYSRYIVTAIDKDLR